MRQQVVTAGEVRVAPERHIPHLWKAVSQTWAMLKALWRRVVDGEARYDQLKQALGLLEILQPVLAQVTYRHPGR
jgi:hypothetical protein